MPAAVGKLDALTLAAGSSVGDDDVFREYGAPCVSGCMTL